MLKQLPNVITSLNLLCGCVAVLFAVSGDLISASVFAFLGIFFDFFDGLAARLLNAHSEVGLQFDSLADMITSGLVPGIVMMKLLERATGSEVIGFSSEVTESMSWKWARAPSGTGSSPSSSLHLKTWRDWTN